jgi:hypothetical protein
MESAGVAQPVTPNQATITGRAASFMLGLIEGHDVPTLFQHANTDPRPLHENSQGGRPGNLRSVRTVHTVRGARLV